MGDVNKVFLMGNLTRDPELRYTPSGTPVCEFGMAVNRRYTTRDGEQREDPCFVDITVWGRRGEVVSEYFSKGKPIFIEGRLNFDQWEGPDGRRSKLNVVADDFQFVGGGGGGGGGGRGGSRQSRQSGGGRSQQQKQSRPSGPSESEEPEDDDLSEGFDVSDDEIPF